MECEGTSCSTPQRLLDLIPKKLHIVASLAYCATIHAGSYDDSPARKPFVILHLRTERKRTGRS
jgi:hypothetical protein